MEINIYDMQSLLKIPLHHILLANGYEYKKSKTTELYPVLKHTNGDLLLISKMKDNNYMYINLNDQKDKGNIFRFCQNRGGLKTGITAQNLVKQYKKYIEDPNLSQKLKEIPNSLSSSSKQEEEILDAYNSFQDFDTKINTRLTNNRMIDKNIINDFKGLKIDNYGNIIIPMYKNKEVGNEDINYSSTFLCGYVSKLQKPYMIENELIKSKITGKKGLEILTANMSNNPILEKNYFKNIRNVFITESIIDTLSLYEMQSSGMIFNHNSLLIGTSGNINVENKEISNILLYIAKKTDNKAVFHLGFDNDDNGEKYHKDFNHLLRSNNINLIKTHKPLIAKDFNDELKILKIVDYDPKDYHNLTKESLSRKINLYYNDVVDLLQRKKTTNVLRYGMDQLIDISKIEPSKEQINLINMAIKKYANKNTKER